MRQYAILDRSTAVRRAELEDVMRKGMLAVSRDNVLLGVRIELNKDNSHGLIVTPEGHIVGDARIFTREDVEELEREMKKGT